MSVKLSACVGSLVLALAAPWAAAQSFPSKPVRIVVPAPPGGTVDATSRLMATELSKLWGQPVVIDNKPGAQGMITQTAVAGSPADGHVLGVQASGFATVIPLQHGDRASSLTAVTPIGFVSEWPLTVVTSAKSPYNNWKELVSHAAANKTKINYGITGIGGKGHLTGEMIKRATGVDMQEVPYKGDSPILTDVIGGQLPIGMTVLGSTLQMIKAGEVKVLAVTTPARVPFAPQIPTLKEQGIDVVATNWTFLFGPPSMDPKLVEQINRDLDRVLKTPALVQFFNANALLLESLDIPQLRAKLKDEVDSNQLLIKELKLPVN